MALMSLHKISEAIESFKRAVHYEPDTAETHFLLADALYQQGRLDEAVVGYTSAIQLKPEFAEAHNNLAITLKELGQWEQAAHHQQRAVSLDPDNVMFHCNLASIQQEQGHLNEALNSCQHIRDLAPDRPEVHFNLGCILRDMGHMDEAVASNQKALDLRQDFAEAHWNLAICFLLAGRLTEAWREFPWRRKINYTASYPHRHPQPRWDGAPLQGQRLLVHGEQDLRDVIQFARYLPLVKNRCAHVIFAVWQPLMGLLRPMSGIDELIPMTWNDPPAVDFDMQVSILDLPAVFGTTLETIPNTVPYLYADEQKTESWRSRLDTQTFKIGIVWAGSPRHANDRRRSCALTQFEPLSHIANVQYYSLQKELPHPRDRDTLGLWNIPQLADQFHDFTDTAAAIANLDLVISADTAVLHLAGALGKPVWGLIPYGPDWRWMLHREDSPWYPTLRLFRQSAPGDWQGVFQRVTETLQEQVG
jgi:Flp pilus assembly protein TadD